MNASTDVDTTIVRGGRSDGLHMKGLTLDFAGLNDVFALRMERNAPSTKPAARAPDTASGNAP